MVANTKTTLVRETYGGEIYEYYPIGNYVVLAPDVCGGRPTFKGSRLEVPVVLDLLAEGWSIDRLIEEYGTIGLTRAAIMEALHLAAEALRSVTESLAA